MISGLIPHRYAMALYKYARETGSQQPIYDAMKTVLAAYSDNKDLQKTMSNPYVKGEDKRKVLDGLCQAKPDSPFDRFVQLVLDHKREEFFQLMALAYRDIYRKENNISQVRIVTAVEIPDTEMKRLHDVVEKSFPKSKFEYEHEVDPEVIGGFVIDVDSTRMDASISGELQQLRQNLLTGNN